MKFLSLILLLAALPCGAKDALPDQLTADCSASASGFGASADPVLVIDQFSAENKADIVLKRSDYRMAFGPPVPRWVGTGSFSLDEGYKITATVDFLKNDILGDFTQPASVLGADVQLITGDKVVGAATLSTVKEATTLSVETQVSDVELQNLITSQKLPLPSINGGYGRIDAFRYWVAFRDGKVDLATAVKPLNRVKGRLLPLVKVSCTVSLPQSH